MQIDWWTLLLQTINFLIVIWLLSRFLYRPVQNIIAEREAADQAASAVAQQKADAADKVRREYEEKRAQLEKSHQTAEAAFHQSLEAERAKSCEAAKQEAAALLEDARTKIEREERQALKSLKQEVQALAGDLARLALAAPLTPTDSIAAVTSHLDQLSSAELSNLKRDLEPSGATLTIVSSGPLSDADEQAWRGALTDRFGADAPLVFTIEPEILGGAELGLPHANLRFSVADRLSRAIRSMEV